MHSVEKKTWLQKSTLVFLASSAVGAGILFWSAADWFALMSGMRQRVSFCAINQYWDCDRAGMSVFGSFFDIPVGVFGVAWFVVALFLGLGPSRFRNLFRAVLVAGVLAVVVFSSFLFLYLKTGCLTCLSAYLCILLSVVAGWKMSLREGELAPSSVLGGATGVVFVALVLFAVNQRNNLGGKIPMEEFQAWFKSLPTATVKDITPMSKGADASAAKIQVIEFSDFGCPFCALAAGIMLPYLSLQPDVRISYFPFPLDASCNPLSQRTVHAGSCDWSKAAFCANEQGKGWKVHDGIFRGIRAGSGFPALSDASKIFELDAAAFDDCMKGAKVSDQLRQVIEAANELQVSSTPTFVINGKVLRGFVPMPLLRRLIEELRKTPS